MSRTERRAWLGRRGVAAVEFAFVTPVLLLLVLAMSDMILHMRTVYRVERMAAEILNAAAQVDPLTEAQLRAILSAAPSIGGSSVATRNNSGIFNDGAIHVSAIQRLNATTNTRLWTVSNYTSPPATVISRMSANPVLPAGVIVPNGAQILAVEVLSQRERWTTGITRALVGGTCPPYITCPIVIYALAVAQPRNATLTGILPP